MGGYGAFEMFGVPVAKGIIPVKEIEEWDLYYDNVATLGRPRDTMIAYAYQNNNHDCEKFCILHLVKNNKAVYATIPFTHQN